MKNKNGLSVVVSYILLVVISIAMSVIVYQWLKTYVPSDSLQCSDGTSLFIRDINYDCTIKELNITVENNGKFSIQGYYIHVSNKQGENLPTIDISNNVTYGGNSYYNSSIIFDLFKNNFLIPGNQKLTTFNVSGYSQLYKVELIPIRIEEIKGTNRTVACSNDKVSFNLACA